MGSEEFDKIAMSAFSQAENAMGPEMYAANVERFAKLNEPLSRCPRNIHTEVPGSL